MPRMYKRHAVAKWEGLTPQEQRLVMHLSRGGGIFGRRGFHPENPTVVLSSDPYGRSRRRKHVDDSVVIPEQAAVLGLLRKGWFRFNHGPEPENDFGIFLLTDKAESIIRLAELPYLDVYHRLING